MKSIMREVKNVALNVATWTLTYFALFQNIDGALNVSIFIWSVMTVFALIMHTDSVQMDLSKIKRSIFYLIFIFGDMAMMFAFVWFGHYVIGTLILLQSIIAGSAWSKT